MLSVYGVHGFEENHSLSGFETALLGITILVGLLTLRIPVAVAMLVVGMGGYIVLSGLEPLLNYAKSAAYADFVASGKVQIRLRNLVKTHPVPFQAKESGDPKYIVLTRVSSSDPLLDNMAKLAKVFEDAGACTLAYGTIITGSNAGNRLLGITYPSMSAIETAYDMLGSDADYQALLEDIHINMRHIVRLA